MKPYGIDVSVLLIFFTRHEQFKRVFDVIRQVRPSRLFLYQDGPRIDRPDDIINIKKCREIAENIDWDCQVQRLYQEKNIGVDPSGYIADTWAFSQTDKCIVLEDDVVPSPTLFAFHKAMLDKYENDERIMLISGMNLEGITKGIDSDYFFSYTTITYGWASWSRVVKQWDSMYSFLNDPEKLSKVEEFIKDNGLVRNMTDVFRRHLISGKEHFETILISNQYLHRGYTIVPVKNMVVNIGAVPDSAHYGSELAFVPKGLRRMFTMPVYDVNVDDLKHPLELYDNRSYKNKVYWIHGWNHPFVRALRFLCVCIKKIFKGRFLEVCNDIKIRIKK